jgi:1,2-phenylacetyl-CoA epoxidase catalytic subunit
MAFECDGNVSVRWARGFNQRIALLNKISNQILIDRDFFLQTFCCAVRLTNWPVDCQVYIPTIVRIFLYEGLETMWRTEVVTACFESLPKMLQKILRKAT